MKTTFFRLIDGTLPEQLGGLAGGIAPERLSGKVVRRLRNAVADKTSACRSAAGNGARPSAAADGRAGAAFSEAPVKRSRLPRRTAVLLSAACVIAVIGAAIGFSFASRSGLRYEPPTWEELTASRSPMDLPNRVTDRELITMSLQDYIERCRTRGISLSAVAVTVLRVRYYLAFDSEDLIFDGFSVVEMRIDSVSPQNDAGLKEGETVAVKDDAYLLFSEDEDFLAFFEEKTGIDMKKATEADVRNIGDAVFELIPRKGTEYVFRYRPNGMLFRENERYTLALIRFDGETPGYSGDLYTAFFILPESVSQEELSDFGMKPDPDILTKSEELRDLVKGKKE